MFEDCCSLSLVKVPPLLVYASQDRTTEETSLMRPQSDLILGIFHVLEFLKVVMKVPKQSEKLDLAERILVVQPRAFGVPSSFLC